MSTLAVTLVGAVALITDLAIRMMWWNGGRERRDGDHGDSGNPLAIIGFVLLILAPIIARAMQATISRRRETLADVERVPAHEVSTRFDLRSGKIEERHDGDAFRVHGHGTLMDRTADEWGR